MAVVFDDEQPAKSRVVFDDEVTPTGLPSLNAPTEQRDPRAQFIKDISAPLNAPERAGRAAAIGVQGVTNATGINPLTAAIPGAFPVTDTNTLLKAISDGAQTGSNLWKAVKRAAQAYLPNFQPKPGEAGVAKFGEAAGNAVEGAALGGPIGDATAALTPAMEGAGPIATKAAQYGVQIGMGSATGAAFSAKDQLTTDGKIDPVKLAAAAKIGAAIPAAIGLADISPDVISAVVKKAAPEVLAKTANIPQQATRIRLEDPTVMEKYGKITEDEIGKTVQEVQSKLLDMRKAAQKAYQSDLEKIGLQEGFDKQVERLATGTQDGQRSPQEIAEAFRSSKDIPENVRLKYLYELRHDIDNQVDFRPGVVRSIDSKQEGLLKTIRGQINQTIPDLPGGKELRKADDAFSKVAGLYDDLQKKLVTPGTAEDTLMKLFRRDLNVLTNGRSKDVVNALNDLDKMAGEPVTKKLWDQLTAYHFNQYTGKGLGSYMVGQGVGATAMAAILGHPAALLAAGASLPLVSPKVASGVFRAGETISPYVQKFISEIKNPRLQQAIIAATVGSSKETK